VIVLDSVRLGLAEPKGNEGEMEITDLERKKLEKHVIVALDLDGIDDALELAGQLRPFVSRFKIGSRMFTRFGPRVLDKLGELGAEIFLDLKYHDIPSVVGEACKAAGEHPAVFMMTVHASGGTAMVAAAAEGLAAARAAREGADLAVVAVTALTSLSPGETRTLGIDLGLEDWAEKLARLALNAGADGLVCSAHEVERLRSIAGDEHIFVTPGIRPAGTSSSGEDQTRIRTPAHALAAGSDFLVIGRPIYKATDPVAAIQGIARGLI
jgi:orotidine-5'-phosphate decarboxylase